MDPGESSKTPNRDAVSQLYQAVIAGDENLVKELLGHNKNIAQASDGGGRTVLHVAVEHAQLSLIPILLDHGADIEALDPLGRTLLHQAVGCNNVPLSTLLLECGANVEATTSDSEKPLWIAANHGYELVAKVLLQYKADVESFNTESGTTALFEAVNRGHVGLIKLLLDNGADTDARRVVPQTVQERMRQGPPRPAMSPALPHLPGGGALPPPPPPPVRIPGYHPGVAHPHQALKFKKSSLPGGIFQKSVSTPRRRKPEIVSVLPPRPASSEGPRPLAGQVQSHPMFAHPHHMPRSRRPIQPSQGLPPLPPPPVTLAPQPGQPKEDRERPLHRAVMNGNIEIVKLLLQHGADIGIRGKDGRSAQQVADEQNVAELAALLRSGLLLEGPAIKNEEAKQRDLPSVDSQALPPPRGNPAKMAACKAFEATIIEFYTEDREQRYQQSAPIYELLYGKGPQGILGAERPESVAGKTANFTWYHLPANNMEWVEGLMTRLSMSHNADTTMNEKFKEKLGIFRRKTQKGIKEPRPSFMRPHSREITDDASRKGNHAGATTNSSMFAFCHPKPRLERKSEEATESKATFPAAPDPATSGIHHDHVEDPHSATRETEAVQTQVHDTEGKEPEKPETGVYEQHPASPQSRNKSNQSKQPQQHQDEPLDRTHPYLHLIRGYFQQGMAGETTSWQPRRSLDAYFYHHLPSTMHRDGDQVVLRYTRNHQLPVRIFMVDQLWMWILGDRTIITCSALNFDSWIVEAQSKAGKSGNINSRWALAREDPMNAHQKVLRHLKSPHRQPVTSVHDLACLITDTCTSLFDQHNIQDEFQFLDFFEREIARLSDLAMRRLEDFRRSLELARPDDGLPNTLKTIDIEGDIAFLIEAQDICDELEILRTVLRDQNDTLTEMKQILITKGQPKWTGSRVSRLHQQRVDRMQQIATSTKESLYHLLDLKQKQANFSEAIYARRQAEETTQQTRLAADNSEVTANQLKIMTKQAEETGRQSQTLTVFTVVTITFLPSSFMAAVFAIGLDAFPLDDNGKLPLGYFLRYLFAVSCAVTIPLIFIAFNLPRIAAWWSRVKRRTGRIWSEDPGILWTGAIGPVAALAVEGSVVAAIWTAPLAAGIKAAVTACISLVIAVAVCLFVLQALSLSAQRRWRQLDETDSDDASSPLPWFIYCETKRIKASQTHTFPRKTEYKSLIENVESRSYESVVTFVMEFASKIDAALRKCAFKTFDPKPFNKRRRTSSSDDAEHDSHDPVVASSHDAGIRPNLPLAPDADTGHSPVPVAPGADAGNSVGTLPTSLIPVRCRPL
ncbi:hypothetical protein DL766_007498 [Monosporascus sp. MC13-8B]|uniref:Ankyrin repeat protein n=1 Tax=Monosporascus cannonballus TaxID=155416 RepID=A0ABY0GZQ9_9PEZI|nr:hypothetical protein DL762_007388 [Monosporascus cannonballus]RYP23493.1 hypothetical protein DL766_007498 [Monosporascus sp. MC13-8B]